MTNARLRRLSAGLLLSGCLLMQTASAQQLPPLVPMEQTLQVTPGSVFEIVGAGKASDAWSWTLMRDGNFVEASRERVFHVQLQESGAYRLEASVTDGATGLQTQRVFPISVSDSAPVPQEGGDLIVLADPVFTAQGIRFPAGRQLLTLTPTAQAAGRVFVDMNTVLDTDGDGNPANDDDGTGTLFSTDKTPLHIWYPALSPNQGVVISGQLQSGTPVSATVALTAEDIPVSNGDGTVLPPLTPGEIHANVRGNGDVSFALPITSSRLDTLLYRWNFGDGRTSLRDIPTHRYVKEGTYTVTAEAIDMSTGKVVTRTERSITLSKADMEPVAGSVSSGATSATGGSASSVSGSASSGSGIGIVWTILKFLVVGLLAIAVGLGLAWGGGILMRYVRSRQDESVITPAQDTAAAPDLLQPAPPMTLRRTPAADMVDAPVASKEQEPTAQPQVIADEEETPPWLRKGLETPLAEPSSRPVETPVAAPVPAEPTSTPAPAPVAEESVPPWLQQTNPEPEAQAPVTRTPSPEPAPLQSPAPVETSATPPQQESLPPWLTAMDTPVAPAAQEPISEPVTTTPAGEPQLTPVEPLPEPAPAVAVDAPAAPLVSEPAPLPAPESPALQQTAAPIPVQTETPITPGATPATAQTAPTTSEKPVLTPEQLEKERERRRKKRQRYRENLKKREMATKINSLQSAPVPQPVETPKVEPVKETAPPPNPVPAVTGPSDDSIVFQVRADSITPPEEPKDDQAGNVGHP